MKIAKTLVGEIIGTFMMCFLGIGAVATATLYGALTGPGQIGLVWGIAIALGIFMTRSLSDAHFNPAVTLAMCISGRNKWSELPVYFIGQCIGAFLGAGALWILFADSVAKNLANAGLTMSTNSIGSAATIWAEVFPNSSQAMISMQGAMFAEGFAVFILCPSGVVVLEPKTGTEIGRIRIIGDSCLNTAGELTPSTIHGRICAVHRLMNNRGGVADKNAVFYIKVRWLPAPILIIHTVELVFKKNCACCAYRRYSNGCDH